MQWSLPPTEHRFDARQLIASGDRDGLSREVLELLDGDEPVWITREVPGWYPWALSHGEGLHPLQWITSSFMHGNLPHLLGNMLFLWVFGLVVEGRIGAFWFAVLYSGCCVVQNLLGQLMFLWSWAPVALGASGGIYSIMMIAAFWAPRDHIQSVLLIFYQFIRIDVPVLIMAALYFLMDFGSAMFLSFNMSTPLLHVTGAAVGIVVGITTLAMDVVDCEQRDLFSMFREVQGRKVPKRPRRKSREELIEEKEARQSLARRLEQIDRNIGLHLSSGRPDEVLALLKHRRRLDPGPALDEQRLLVLLGLLQKQGRWDEFLHHSDDYIARFAERTPILLLSQARIQLQERHRPRKCLELLRRIDQSRLSGSHLATLRALARSAQDRIRAGELDFAD